MPRARGFDSGFAPGFGVGPYWYVLGPWVWDTSGTFPFWRAPDLTVGLVDLRTNAQAGQFGGTPQGSGFFVTAKDPGSAYTVVGRAIHFGQEAATIAHRDAWQAATGFRPDGALLSDLLYEHLTTFADPDGQAACKPLMPTVQGGLDLHVGGHSLVRRDRFTQAHPHWNKVRDCLRRQFRGLLEAAESGRLRTHRGIDREHHRRILDYWCKKYRVDDWQDLVPLDLRAYVPGRLPHETTLTDNFNRTDADALGTASGGGTWAEVNGDTDIVTNVAQGIAGGAQNTSRLDSDLSSDDHYCQAVIPSVMGTAGGPTARHSSSALTYYYADHDSNVSFRLFKVVTGGFTSLGTNNGTPVGGDIVKVECNGSTIRRLVNAAEQTSVTDTAITGNLRCGMNVPDAGGQLDDFEAADLAAGGPTVPALDEGMLVGGFQELMGGLGG